MRAYAGTRPVAATVPRPDAERAARAFPYSGFPAYADLFVPMVYWSCNEPGALVEQSLRELGALLPVAPVGQAYDMGDGGRPPRDCRPAPRPGASWTPPAAAAPSAPASGPSSEMGAGQLEALTAYPWPAPG